MQINPSIGAHTLALFGLQARGSNQQPGLSESARAPTAIGPASRLEPARATEMQGVYADPRTPGPAQAADGLVQRTIDALRSVYTTEMQAIEQAMQGQVEAALGRELAAGESIHSLSGEDHMTLPGDLWESTYEVWGAALDMRIAMGETRSISTHLAITDENRDASAEELIDAAIASDVDAQLGAIQRAKKFALENPLMELAGTGGLSEDVRRAFAASSEEEIGAMRDELIAARKARIASGELSVTVGTETVELASTGYGQGGTGVGGTTLSFHVLRFA